MSIQTPEWIPDHVMIDIETLGLEPGCAVLSIGAVEFGPDGLADTFERSISLESCEAAGLTIDAATLEWWLDQDESVQDVLVGGDPLEEALEDFSDWFPIGAKVWANAPSFDCSILEAAFEAVGMSEPWSFRDERCVRTLRSLPVAVDLDQEGNTHDALDDAIHQARIVSETLDRMERVIA